MSARIRFLMLLAALCAAPAAQAQFAVIDVSAVTQLIEQVRTLQSQLSTARDHLAQARSTYQSMTGERGMQQLLPGMPRNYLPGNWTALQGAGQASTPDYGALGGMVRDILAAQAILTPQQLALLPKAIQQQIALSRGLAALSQSVARQALTVTSNRFGSLQQLIDALPAAVDQKGVLDLQARIGAENAMLQNEQSKLQILSQIMLAEERASRQEARERALAGHGLFAARFEPTP